MSPGYDGISMKLLNQIICFIAASPLNIYFLFITLKWNLPKCVSNSKSYSHSHTKLSNTSNQLSAYFFINFNFHRF